MDSEFRAPPPKRQELENILTPLEDTEHEQATSDSLINGRPPFPLKSKPAKIRSASASAPIPPVPVQPTATSSATARWMPRFVVR
jgi:hypothetical protein